ncbi:MAG: hypothetical protein V3U76_19860 [Granulosicoccus sp.]
MPTQSRAKGSQKVIRLKLKSVSRGALQAAVIPRSGAELFSVRQHLRYRAAIDVEHLLQTQFAKDVHDRVFKEVRQLLDREFGCLRVYRNRRVFIVQHHSVEALIAGLLRCQLLAKRIKSPANNDFDELTEQTGIALGWGIGRSVLEAEGARLKRRRQK